MTKRQLILFIVLTFRQANSFLTDLLSHQSRQRASMTQGPLSLSPEIGDCAASRRNVLATCTLPLVISAFPGLSSAAGPPTKEELDKIVLGYKQIQYLLNNFESETTVCRENGGECKRDAEPIRRALGLRSTTDPLFQVEKIFAKVKNMDIDPDKLEAFFEASEDWNSAMTMSNSMAFISQFGGAYE